MLQRFMNYLNGLFPWDGWQARRINQDTQRQYDPAPGINARMRWSADAQRAQSTQEPPREVD